MNSEIRKLLESVKNGDTNVDEALLQLKMAPFEDIGYAKVDLHRKVRPCRRIHHKGNSSAYA